MEEEPQPHYIPSLLELQLLDAIVDNLNNHICSNASFLAERLLSEKDTEEYRQLLAECYIRENKPYQVIHWLKNCKTEYSRYLLGLSYYRCGKIREAEQVLRVSVPNKSYGHYLLGLIYEKLTKFEEARFQFQNAVDLNPSLWAAFERLAKYENEVETSSVMIFNDQQMKRYEASKRLSQNIFKTVNILREQVYAPIGHKYENVESENKGEASENVVNRQKAPMSEVIKQPFSKITQTPSSKQSQQKSVGFRKKTPSLSQTHTSLPTLLKAFSHPYLLTLTYSPEAFPAFSKLPYHHQTSSWALEQQAKLYMDQSNYLQAEKLYAQLHNQEPTRLSGMDYYSSCLLLQKKKDVLVKLAHKCMETANTAHETWTVIGNCFSLQKDRENAIRYLKRALNVNKANSYTNTLVGYELLQNEQVQEARQHFEKAINLDQKCYKAWFGLGLLNYKGQKYEKAVECFTRSQKINRYNHVVPTYIGMSQTGLNKHYEALEFYLMSEKLEKNNGLNRYQKAQTMIKLEQYEEALKELQCLAKEVPKEQQVYITIGKIYKKIGKIQDAFNTFTYALSLENPDKSTIKGLIENLQNQNPDFPDDFDF